MARVRIAFLAVALLLLFRVNAECPKVIVEKGQSTHLDCGIRINVVNSVTWQLISATGIVNLTTCNFLGQCVDHRSSIYSGQAGTVLTVPGGSKARLNIASASIDETSFRCVSDNGLIAESCSLEVYAWPLPPTCSSRILTSYVEITCSTEDVFPDIRASIFRLEEPLSQGEIDSNNAFCTTSLFGAGTKGDYSATCTWRISYPSMIRTSTFYVQMRAAVSNYTLVNRPAVVSQAITVNLEIPTVVVHKTNCPAGPGVRRGHITIGSSATCKCELQQTGFLVGQARWYTRHETIVGAENTMDKSSTLTIWFNSSDPDQSYECRAINPTRSYRYLKYIPLFISPGCYLVIEKGLPAYINHTSPKTVASLTWQVFNGSGYDSLTTCYPSLHCTADKAQSVYLGQVISSSSLTNTYTSRLGIYSTRINETTFRLLSNSMQILSVCVLEVYAWPTKPVCQPLTIDSTNTFVELTCTVSNVYPQLTGSIHRVGVDLSPVEYDVNNSVCTETALGLGLYGDVSETCTWRFPIAKMKPTLYYYYIDVKAALTDYTRVQNAALLSENATIVLRLPVPVLNDCPTGPGVVSRRIKKGTTATCRCDLSPIGVPPGQARWYTASGQIVGQEDPTTGSSTLTVKYNPSDINRSYECRPITQLPGATEGVTFTPTFTTSASGGVFGGQARLFLLLAVAITSYLSYHDITE